MLDRLDLASKVALCSNLCAEIALMQCLTSASLQGRAFWRIHHASMGLL